MTAKADKEMLLAISSHPEIVGVINTYRNIDHLAAISYANPTQDTAAPEIIIDDTTFKVIPWGAGMANQYITNAYIDYSRTPWSLVIDVVIDGVPYSRHIPLED